MSEPETAVAIDEKPAFVATPEDEAAAVQGLNTAENHPDNVGVFEETELSEPDAAPEQPVSEEELAQAIAGVDLDDVDLVGYDDSDLVIDSNTGATVPEELGELPDPDDNGHA